jgi:hypothetical protein
MAAETFLMCMGTLFLARFTAHRIAGPYVRLMQTCKALRDGEDRELRFRAYDHLDDAAKIFNEMTAALVARGAGKHPPQQENP